jgi:hypothetical protein
MLISAGYLNATAILGDTLSKEQREVLLAEYEAGGKVTLFWPIQVDVVSTLSEKGRWHKGTIAKMVQRHEGRVKQA